MFDAPTLVNRLKSVSEYVLIVMACLSPWAFGSVEAWAQLLLVSGIVVLAALQFLEGWITGVPRWGRLLSAPSLALSGMAVLAMAQAFPLPANLSRWIAPQVWGSRAALAPDHPQALIDGTTVAVDPPARTFCLEPEATRHAAAQICAAWILFQCASGLGATIPRLRRFGLAVVVNATLLSLFSLLQALTWNGRIFGFRSSPIGNRWYTGGPFVCHNHLAAYLNLGLGFCLGALIASLQAGPSGPRDEMEKAGDRGRFLWLAYAAAVLLVGLVGTHSRGGFLAMLTAGGITLLFLRPRGVKLHLGLLVVALIVPIFLLAIGTDSPFQRMATISEAGDTGLNGRTSLWAAAVRAWAERPLLGAGMGNFEVAIAPALDRDLGVTYQHAENEYLEVAVEAGLVGLAIFLVLLGTIAARGHRTLKTVVTRRDRAWVLGALFGMIALAVQSMGDFPLHVPGITVTLVILIAYLFSLGKPPSKEHVPAIGWAKAGTLADLVVCGLAVAVTAHQYTVARAEAARATAGFPMSGAAVPGRIQGPADRRELELARAGLTRALAFRPDSYENHFQLGLVEMRLYSLAAEELLGPGASEESRPADDPGNRPLESDPLWLLGTVHAAKAEDLDATGGLLAHAPIRDHLIPAARSLLEARRCSPFRAPVHVHLACVDYLLDHGEPARVHIERALRLAGANSQVLALAGVAAVQVGALDLAAESWKRSLLTGLGDWREIADMAHEVLSPREILERVIPPGRNYEIWFADLLYTEPGDEEIRADFLRASLERVPRNLDLSSAERSWLQGQACARLDDREQARRHMRAALSLEPRKSPWRLEYVTWLLAWGQSKEAHTQARIGVELDPYHGGLRNALARTVEVLARGAPDSADGQPHLPSTGNRTASAARLGASP